jgi:hypothetical protein
MKIDDLFAGKGTAYPINKRYPGEKLEAYEKDLRKVIELVKEGNCMPTRAELRTYFLTELDMDITTGSIHRHINLLKEGKQLWVS